MNTDRLLASVEALEEAAKTARTEILDQALCVTVAGFVPLFKELVSRGWKIEPALIALAEDILVTAAEQGSDIVSVQVVEIGQGKVAQA